MKNKNKKQKMRIEDSKIRIGKKYGNSKIITKNEKWKIKNKR